MNQSNGLHPSNRREFLSNVGQGMLITSLGSALATDLGAGVIQTGDSLPATLPAMGTAELEALVRLMRKTPAAELQPKLVAKLKDGLTLETLVAAGALANARSFGGTDYDGYHAFMAMMPAYRMAQRMPKDLRALPVLKVIYRSTSRIQRTGKGRKSLPPVEAPAAIEGDRGSKAGNRLRETVRGRDMAAAEREFKGLCAADRKRAYEDLQWLVQDATDVHRVVLPWRAWDTLQILGAEHAHDVLRQSVRFCVNSEQSRVSRRLPEPGVRSVLPKVLDENRLLGKAVGAKKAEDAFVEELAAIVFGPDREQAAAAVGKALADGYSPDSVSEAIALAANRLLLHTTGDPNRRGGVHGASVGVHASDAANAWRHIAQVCDGRNSYASLIVAAYHTAGQTGRVDKQPLAYEPRSKELAKESADVLLRRAEQGVEDRNQIEACAAVHRYGELGHPVGPVVDLMLRYAVSEDGALHAEKYFHTATEEFGLMRSAFRWRQLVALARVTASEFGEPAPGCADARRLLLG